MQRLLAYSTHYRIVHDYETVFLMGVTNTPIIIGDFYGDPAAALIDWQERWCIVVGDGMILYYLRLPFVPYPTHIRPAQWVTLVRDSPQSWWIDMVAQIADTHVRFVVDPASDRAGVYDLAVMELTVTQVIPRPEDG